jgi:hypothetical protein
VVEIAVIVVGRFSGIWIQGGERGHENQHSGEERTVFPDFGAQMDPFVPDLLWQLTK